ncbi:MAG: hypothetical protein ACPGVB_11655, partial [Chitinophagales bacterium]
MTLKVVQIGMGPLGIKVADFIAQRKGIQTVAAVDKNPALIGKSLHDLKSNLDNQTFIYQNLAEAIEVAKPDLAILTTVSDMECVTPQIEEIVGFGIPVVTTCEELSYPWETNAILANRMDEAAKKHKVAVVATGVNPGFMMDALPTFLTAVCQNVERIEVRRFQDATYRRVPFQKKIGAGLSLEEFEERKENGTLRHVGLAQSMQFIAHKMGWKLDKVEDIISPVIASEDITANGSMAIPKGNATGVCQIGRAYVNGEEKIKVTDIKFENDSLTIQMPVFLSYFRMINTAEGMT